ncbi:hypothetical protein [Mycolicibacterium thermoresistibile]
MGSRHRMPAPPDRARPRTGHRTNVVIGTISTAVAGAGLLAGGLVQLTDAGENSTRASDAVPPPATAPGPPAADSSGFISQQGTIVAVTPDAVTTRSADGFTQTYRLTPQTTTITGPETPSTAPGFTVNDEVEIVGSVQGGTAVATAVADRSMTGPDGPPMHVIDVHTVSNNGVGPVTVP